MVRTATKGFTLVEVMLVMGLMAILAGVTFINLIRPQTAASLDSITSTLIADLRSQQLKAMAGDTFGTAAAQQYGVRFASGNYTLFKGTTYSGADADNFVVTADPGVSITTTLPSSQVVFTKGTGVATGLASSQTVTVTSSALGQSKVITINRLGVLTVN